MNDQMISYQRKLHVRHHVDVLVVGAGPAGIAAALAAARQGVRVLLIEPQTCFGGMGTAAGVPMFCQFSDGINFLAGGIGREVYERCHAAGVFGPDFNADRKCRNDSNPIHGETLKRVYDRMIVESGIGYALQTYLIDVLATGTRVDAAICSAKSGVFAVQAKVYVDCTGDGDLAAWAGASFKKGDARGRLQPGTLCSVWGGIDWRKARESGMYGVWPAKQQHGLADAIRAGVLSEPDTNMPGIWPTGEGLGGGNVGHAFGVDGTDERSLTEALIRQRERLVEYREYFRKYCPGFDNIELAATGAILGIRETRRITGDYELTLDDFQRRAVFPDEIGRYNYSIDVHASSTDAEDVAEFDRTFHSTHMRQGESYGIPYRILTPRGMDNLLVAGRCVSTDRYMQGSIRVMPGCYITGQAAGVAAAMAARSGKRTHVIDVGELQTRLKTLGAYLPNA